MSNAPHTTSAGFPLHAGMFEAPPIAIPNRAGDAYKIEQVVERSPERTVKLVWWFGPDDDRDPHSHPWAFDSEILAGGYTSVTYWIENAAAQTIDAGCGDYGSGPEYEATNGTRLPGGPIVYAGDEVIPGVRMPIGIPTIRCESRIVRAGDRVHYPLHEFHLVKDVLPGTRTRMTCGPARPGNQWDYLDPRTGRVYPYQEQPDTTFVERMLALNPWRRTEQARLDARAAKHDADRLAGLIDRLGDADDEYKPSGPFAAFARATVAAAKDPAAPVPALLIDFPMGGDA